MASHLRVFDNKQRATDDQDDWVVAHAVEVAAIDHTRATADLRNGDRVYWVTVRTRADLYQVRGMEYDSVEYLGNFDKDIEVEIQSRVR